MAGMERQELNYAALEFLHGRHREGGFRRADGDGTDYTDIKAKWTAILPWFLGQTGHSSH